MAGHYVAQSTDQHERLLSMRSASLGGMEQQHPHTQPGRRVSSLEDAVGDSSKPGTLPKDSEHMQSKTEFLSLGKGLPPEQQQVAQASQRNRSIKLMTAAGTHSAGQLVSPADLAAASTEPRYEQLSKNIQPGLYPGNSQRAAKRQSHTGMRHWEASSIGTVPSTAEQVHSRSATAVLVGEDEEFCVGSGDSR